MGTEVHSKSYMPGYYSMKDLNEDANNYNNWPLHYRDTPSSNGQLYNFSRAVAMADSCLDYDKDVVKQKMLEHEAIFKKQVHELHRLYRIQKDLMDEIRTKDLVLSPPPSRGFLHEDVQKWHSPGLSNCRVPSFSGSDCSPMKSVSGHNSPQVSPFPQKNGCTSKVPEWLESRPSKFRRRIIDLTLPADNYIDPDESEVLKGESCVRERKAVADLNQPIEIEDTDVLAHTSFDGKTLARELSFESRCGSSNSSFSNPYTKIYGNGSGWHPHITNAGHDGKDRRHILQSRTHEIAARLPMHTLNQHQISAPSDWAKSNSHSLTLREWPNGSLAQKPISLEAGRHQDIYSIHSRKFQGPPTGNGVLGERWRWSDGRPDSGLGSKSPFDGNGIVTMSASPGPKGILSRRDDQNGINIMASAVMDLNRVLSDGGEKQENHFAVLPWHKTSTTRKDEAIAKTGFSFKEKMPLQSPANHLTSRTELAECSSGAKILGIPIFGDSQMPKEERSSLSGKSEREVAESGWNMRMLDINLPCDQVPEENHVLENREPSGKVSGLKCEIDLNSCADEGEGFLFTSDRAVERRASVVIDLEAPACPEMEDEIEPLAGKVEHATDETMKIAAEAIIAISSTVVELPEPLLAEKPELLSAENLEWFASIVVKERQVRGAVSSSSTEEFDYFEAMTLKLTEMKDEEHLPQPLVPPEMLKLREEDSAADMPAANQRPQRRGGRQRRDFQRDILPGLATLSRHEVTEDMQTFGGLMRATGHPWSCGSTRRGSARSRQTRPRRRKKPAGCLSQPALPSPAHTPPPVSLTGWGKTRRPRRQRCPAPTGNPQLVQLT